ncbi:MAG: electron transfer flavoprotein subunit alpha/FixB family protein [archaeon]|nr:electron transfer flavoprotein subunit alpha/FixB family protein [archaeon]
MLEKERVKEFSSHKGVWILAEQIDGKLKSVSLELLGVGRKMADKLNEELVTVLLGYNVDGLIRDLEAYGSDKVILVEHELLKQFTVDAYTKVLAELTFKYKPSVFLIGGTLNGRELAPRLAARLNTGITSDCTDFDVNEDGYIIHIKPFSKLMAKIICKTRPQMATAKPNIFKKLEPDWNRRAMIIREKIEISPEDIRTKVLDVIKISKNPYENIEEANIIVTGGKGLGSKENFKLIYELADVIGAAVAGTRSVVDRGWLSSSQQVGQSGKTVAPKLYIAVGISGAMYHTIGMRNSEVIVAINKDPKAPIFQIVTYGIVGDLFKVLPLLIERLKEEVKEVKLSITTKDL